MHAESSKTGQTQGDIDTGRRLIAREIEGLQALSESLGEPFGRAVSLVSAIKGRVIASGMGKSGHIARKIAATLASTGTPAFFVHPGEASHGDLGMVTEQDALLLLSNSGETAELRDMVAYSRRFSIPLIAVVRRETSMLVDAADVALILPEIPEATETGAPTTSTTMMLALGDALAIALAHRKGFSAEDFHLFHPGGKLGARFTCVRDLMHGQEELPLISGQESMREVLLVMTARRFGCAGVTDSQGVLQGIITDGDLRRHMQEDLLHKKAAEVMTMQPLTIRPNALAAEALQLMNERGITALFACEDGKPIGILHIHDCLRAGVM